MEKETATLFRQAIDLDPLGPRPLYLLASLYHRSDRRAHQEEISILANKALSLHPDNHEIQKTVRRLTTPCPYCTDSGSCGSCGGTGVKGPHFFAWTCLACRGKGICLRCGVL